MNFNSRCPRVDVALVFLREDHSLHAGSPGTEGFLVDAADGLHLAGERDLAGDGDVLTERLLFNGREDGAGDGAAGGWAVDISSADDIDVEVVVGKTLVGQLADDGGRGADGVLRHGAGGVIEAQAPLAGRCGGKGGGFDLYRAAPRANDAKAVDVSDLRRVRCLLLKAGAEAACLRSALHDGFGDGDAVCFAGFVNGKAVGIGEKVHGFAAFHGVAADELGDAGFEASAEPFGGAFYDGDDVRGL